MHHHVLFGFKVILGIAVGIALALAFFYIGFTTGYQNGVALGVDRGFSAAQEKVSESGIFPERPAGAKTLSLSGAIAKIEGNKLFLEAGNLEANPLKPATPKSRVITVSSATKIIKRKLKPISQMEKELEEFRKKSSEENLEEKNTVPSPPYPYTETELQFNDLSVDDTITVEAADDIFSAAEFEATKIIIQTRAAAETPAE